MAQNLRQGPINARRSNPSPANAELGDSRLMALPNGVRKARAGPHDFTDALGS